MKSLSIYTLALMACLCHFTWAESKQEKGWALLQRTATNSLNSADGSAYRIQAKFMFTRPGSDPVPGTYKLTWMSADRWRRDIDVGNLQEIAIGAKTKKWIQRSLDVQPLQAHRLNTAVEYLQDLRLDANDPIVKISEQKRDGLKLECVTYKRSIGLDRTICFDDQRGALALVRDGLWEFQYLDPRQFGNKLVPNRIHISDEGKTRVEVEIQNIENPGQPDSTLFTPPPRAQEWADCARPIPGKYLQKVAPKYPEESRQAHQEGTVVLYNVIATDGSLEDVKVIQSAGRYLDEAAMTAVKQWRFVPTTCDGIPIRVENELQVNFTLSY
jgi:TonB family protein